MTSRPRTVSRVASAPGKPASLTKALLRKLPLPTIKPDDDKESRGRVLAIGGSVSVPGAMLLAGVAALRAGAGKLQLATVREAAIPLGFSVPEAMVIGLATARDGEIAGGKAAARLRDHVPHVSAVLIGPGMSRAEEALRLVRSVVPLLDDDAVLVLDGVAVVALRGSKRVLESLRGRVVLTPNEGEMASLMDIEKASVASRAREIVNRVARMFGATVALKGAETWIADENGTCLRFNGGVVGLGTSGSGDTLAGIVTGLSARGASPITAAAWGVWAHGMAGQALTKRTATVGFLARELLAEVPALVGA